MKFNKTFQVTAGSLIIMAMLIMPFSSIQKINAQTPNGVAPATKNTSVSNYINTLSPLISKLPGCTAALETGVKDMFKGIKSIFKKKEVKKATSSIGKAVGINEDSLINDAVDKVMQQDAIKMVNPSGNERLEVIGSIVGDTYEVVQKTEKAVTSDNKNNTCLNSVGKAVIKILINQLTVSMVNWIQTGDFGDPLFITDSSKFFKDLAKNEILTFGQEIKDVAKFPFAQNFMLGVANSFNNKFQDNAQYSLDKVMQQNSLRIGVPVFSPKDFLGDFSKGGWAAYDAMSQDPANNPLGFQLIASSELQKRLIGTDKSAAQIIDEQINRSGGFLDVKVCDDPKGVTKEEDDAAKSGGPGRICKTWKTVTPGAAVANELTQSMNNSKNSLLTAETLNDAIAAILDAALARMSRELTDGATGLANMSTEEGEAYDLTGYDDNGLSAEQTDQIDRDFSTYQRDSSPWLQGHPDFDIRKDVNQALIDEQRIYIEKLKTQSNALLRKSTANPGGYDGLIPAIYQLDYCIPGPNPGWEEDAQNELGKMTTNLSTILNDTKGISDTQGYAWLGTLTGNIGTKIIDWGNSAMDCGSDKGSQYGKFIRSAVYYLTGIGNIPEQEQLCSLAGFTFIAQEALGGYKKMVDKYFPLQILPSVASEARVKFEELPGYEKIVKENENAIVFQETVIKRLQAIKTAIDTLNAQYNNGNGAMGQTEYEQNLITWKNAFARISSGLVSGGDIAHIDELTKQTLEEEKYIKFDLIKGDAGCEKELSSYPIWAALQPINQGGNGWGANWGAQKRPPYLKPHLYDYNLPIVPQGGWVYREGNSTGILGGVVFGACYSNPNCKAQLNITDAWVNDVIDLHAGQTGAALNFSGKNWGGSANSFEFALKIY